MALQPLGAALGKTRKIKGCITGKQGRYTSAKGECVGIALADALPVVEDVEEFGDEAAASPPVGVRTLPGVVVRSSAQQFRTKWWNTIVECMGAMAGCCTTAAFIPQVVEVAITGDTSGLSLPMYCIFVSGVVMWIVYGVCKKAGAMIGANVVTFILAGYILFRIVDNEVFHPGRAAALAGEAMPPMMPPLLPPSPPLAPDVVSRRLLAVVRASAVWRALAEI